MPCFFNSPSLLFFSILACFKSNYPNSFFIFAQNLKAEKTLVYRFSLLISGMKIPEKTRHYFKFNFEKRLNKKYTDFLIKSFTI